MAENYSECADHIWPARSWQNVVFSGGLVRKNELLRKLIQQKLNTPYRLCPLEEDTLLGLMVLALVGLRLAMGVSVLAMIGAELLFR